MTAPRKQTTLLAWMPPQGASGQRHANRALVRAFARAAALPEARTGRVRAILATIAAEAEAEYSAKIGEDGAAPAPAKAPAKARKGARKGASAKAAPKAAPGGGAKVTQGYCKPCKIPFRDAKAHNAKASHKRAVREAVAADNASA